jgi:hypothetical protein
MAAPSGIRDFSMPVPTANSAIRIFIGKKKPGNLYITFCPVRTGAKAKKVETKRIDTVKSREKK